jgi:choline dehydrogenase-like flavoprotein
MGMKPDFDIIIVGSGPAGVSAAFPLLAAGLKVLMVDGGKHSSQQPPSENFLFWRKNDNTQTKWMVGRDFHALRMHDAISPKLRVPTLAYSFDQFEQVNRISSENFVSVGSLATGGLSNAWGCGVARFSATELASFPCTESDMQASYDIVANRIGISGGHNDDLSDYFGLDKNSGPSLEIDQSHTLILNRYDRSRTKLNSIGFILGRSRVAVLNEERGDRLACTRSGNCLWGCQRKALYSATDELIALKRFPNFHHKSGFIVESIIRTETHCSIIGQHAVNGTNQSISARKILLAAGTLATTKIALKALNLTEAVRVLSSPTAAFLLWIPSLLGIPRQNSFGLGQLSFNLKLTNGINGFGSTFSPTGIPMAEFVRHLPLKRRFAVDLLKNLLSSCLIGNVFLPGHLSTAQAKLKNDGSLMIVGGYDDNVPQLMAESANLLRNAYRKLGTILLPMSFTSGRPGSDIHYSGTLPMKMTPTLGETNQYGELYGLPNIHIVDGACLPILSEKSHTMTIMANANRIGEKLSKCL